MTMAMAAAGATTGTTGTAASSRGGGVSNGQVWAGALAATGVGQAKDVAGGAGGALEVGVGGDGDRGRGRKYASDGRVRVGERWWGGGGECTD